MTRCSLYLSFQAILQKLSFIVGPIASNSVPVIRVLVQMTVDSLLPKMVHQPLPELLLISVTAVAFTDCCLNMQLMQYWLCAASFIVSYCSSRTSQ